MEWRTDRGRDAGRRRRSRGADVLRLLDPRSRWSRRSPSRSCSCCAAAPGRAGAPAGHELRPRLGRAATTARCTRCSTRPRSRPSASARFAAAYRRDATTATHRQAHPRPGRQAARRRSSRCSMRRGHPAVRDAARDARGAARPAAARAPPCTSRRSAPVPRPAPAGERLDAPHVARRRERRCSPPTARRWPQGPDRTSPIPDVAGADRRRARADPDRPTPPRTPPQGYPADAKVGTGRARARRSRPSWRARPGGVLLAGHRVLARTAAEPGHDVTTTIDPTLERGRDRRAGRPLRRASRR